MMDMNTVPPGKVALINGWHDWVSKQPGGKGDYVCLPQAAKDMVDLALLEIHSAKPAHFHQWYCKNSMTYRAIRHDMLKMAYDWTIRYLEHIARMEIRHEQEQAKKAHG